MISINNLKRINNEQTDIHFNGHRSCDSVLFMRTGGVGPFKEYFDTSSEVKSEFDKWLNNNYVETYNIDYKYRLEDIESDFSKNLTPADLLQSMRLAKS